MDLFLFCCVLIFCALPQECLPNEIGSQSCSQVEDNKMMDTVEVLEVNQKELLNGAFYTKVSHKRKPIVIRNSLMNTWPAFHFWDRQYITKKLPSVLAYKQAAPDRVFTTFHDNKPLEPFLLEKRWEDYNIKHNVSIDAVFEKSKDTSEDDFFYFSSDVTLLAEGGWDSIEEELSPISPLFVDNEGIQVNLWAGRKGIITASHFDASWNFFGQLHGLKRFTLAPPDSEFINPYPCLHPHIGHAQEENITSTLGVLTVDVKRGDLLIVPPFWWHRVETLEDNTISVNAWSDAPAYQLLHEAYDLPIPLESSWKFDKMVAAVQALILIVTDGVNVNGDAPWSKEGFVRRLVRRRWDNLVTQNSINLPSVEEDAQMFKVACSKSQIEVIDREIMTHKMTKVIKLFQNMHISVIEICLSNYIERILFAVFGVEKVYPFLRYCFS
eukprot:m.102996 g.102996  ORF g.102996 m.102996 type:complete len:440 (-) comp13792_c0_seq1:3238-4557(-)